MRDQVKIRNHDASGRPSDDEVDYLLSGGRLGGSQRSQIFEGVVESLGRLESRAASSTRPRWWPRAMILGAMASVVCAVLWMRSSTEGRHFATKGTPAPAGTAAMDVACLYATLAACPPGSILAFSARGAAPAMFVTAYLEPAGPGPRVWLLANEPVSGQVPHAAGLLARGVRIPDDQEAGAYFVEAIVTARPLSRDEAVRRRDGDVMARGRFQMTVRR